MDAPNQQAQLSKTLTAARVVRGMLDQVKDHSDTRHGVFSDVERDALETLCDWTERSSY